MFALVGSACAPAIRTRGRHSTRRWRIWVIAGLAVLALSAIPPWLSERFVNSAYSSWRTDLARAYEDLDRARQLNALSDTPLLAEGSIAREAGDRERALDAFNEAAEIRPEEWATHYLLAEMLAESDPAAAREQIRLALERNPLDVRGRQLAAELGVPPAAGAERRGLSLRRPRSARAGTRCDRLGTGAGAELRLRVANVRLHGCRRELEQLGDLAVGSAPGEQRQHLALAVAGRARAGRLDARRSGARAR